MKNAKSSMLPLRLLLLYILLISLVPTITFWLDFGNLEESGADQNWLLFWSLILSVPLFIGGILTVKSFRRIWILGSIFLTFAVFHLSTTALLYFSSGFISSPAEYNLAPLYFLRFALVTAIPFVALYLSWRFWP